MTANEVLHALLCTPDATVADVVNHLTRGRAAPCGTTKQVAAILRDLEAQGLVTHDPTNLPTWEEYNLTDKGAGQLLAATASTEKEPRRTP